MPIKKKLIFTFIIFLMTLFVIEVVLRVHDFKFYYNFEADLIGMPLLDMHKIRRKHNRAVSHVPHIFWRLKPNQYLDDKEAYLEPVTINSHGFRGTDWQDMKPKGTYRIICLGDSTTFGWSIGDDETYPEQLKKALVKICGLKNIEVINMAYVGYTSFQGKELFVRQANKYQPDLVIFAFGPNDRLPAIKSDLELEKEGYWEWGPVTEYLYDFQLFKLGKSIFAYLSARKDGIKVDQASIAPLLKRKVSQDEFKNNVRKVKNECDKINADLLLINVDYPVLPKDHIYETITKLAKSLNVTPSTNWKYWDPEKTHRQLSEELSIPWVDMRTLFTKRSDDIMKNKPDMERMNKIISKNKKRVSQNPAWLIMVDNGHPNEWGHEILAKSIAEKIMEMDKFKNVCQPENIK